MKKCYILIWISAVNEGWANREIALENNYLSALEKVYNGEALTEAELTAIERYAAEYPDRVDASVLQHVQQARQVKAEEMKIRGLIDKVDAGKELTDEETKTLQEYESRYPNSNLLGNVKYALDQNEEKKKEQKNIDDESKGIISKAEKAYKNGEIDDKTFQSIKSGIINFGASYVKELLQTKLTDKAVEAFTKSAIEWFTHNINATQIGRSAALVGGGTVTIATDFNPIWAQLARGAVKNGVKYGIPIVGALVDFGMQKASGESTGDALIKTGAHTAIGLKAAAIGTAMGGPFGAALGFGIGVLGSMAFDYVYDNYKDDVIDVGKNAVNAVSDVVGKVGDAISDFGKSLGSVFG
ncbi:hypothetical protein ACVRXQ_13015 [Streptococcus panodentis]|nr:hypothetical protein [Streptococcus panodentis]